MANQSVQQVVDRLRRIAGYQAKFEKSFGTPGITAQRLGFCLAHFQATLVAYDAPIDRFLKGDKDHGMSEIGQAGWKLFNSKGCISCHKLPDFRDDNYHNTGVAARSRDNDRGREAITNQSVDRRAFSTQTLRNLVYSVPFWHNGRAPNIRTAVNHYSSGGAYINKRGLVVRDKFTDPRVRAITLSTEDVDKITHFLTYDVVSHTYPKDMVSPPLLR
jgi:cytochrome c peroxidase